MGIADPGDLHIGGGISFFLIPYIKTADLVIEVDGVPAKLHSVDIKYVVIKVMWFCTTSGFEFYFLGLGCTKTACSYKPVIIGPGLEGIEPHGGDGGVELQANPVLVGTVDKLSVLHFKAGIAGGCAPLKLCEGCGFLCEIGREVCTAEFCFCCPAHEAAPVRVESATTEGTYLYHV